MMSFHKAIATVCGIGYIGKGSGTIAAVAYCIFLMFLPPGNKWLWQPLLLAAVLAVGTWNSNVLESIWGHDSNKIVIDEVAGMMITLLFVPIEIKYVAFGLVLFRFFDIVKPLGIKKAELLPSGWGVMADDVLAGVYSWLILQLVIEFIPF
ncbi:phosphatidylglycerophosphatase A [Parasediminibacterium sp. JCM 36343]|uniref:phosphatidylglycerophosphatase A family protein n=1 Tax=Parasediminibacterium sp. JCM 36343 TaxID=3374279 RepID=UPI00397C4DEA